MSHRRVATGKGRSGAAPIANDLAPHEVKCRISLDRWLPLGLILLTLIAFSPLFDAQFTQRDDMDTVGQNPAMLGGPGQIIRFWTNLKEPTGEIYIPLTQTIWYGLARIARLPQSINGSQLSPTPFHAANVLLHAISGCIVYLILRRFVKNPWACAAGALVYLLHPLQVEAVGWVSGTKDVLGGVLVLASIYAFLRFVQSKSAEDAERPSRTVDHRWRWYLLATFFFVLAMLAKPASVVTPLLALIVGVSVIVISDGARDRARQIKTIMLWLLPWLALAAPIILEGKRVQPAPGVPDLAWWARPLIAGDALAFYLWKLVAPISLGTDYGRTPTAVLQSGVAYWTWITPVALLALAILLRRRLPLILSAVLIFFLAPLPVLGFVKFIYQFFSTVSDHYVYVAMVGPALAAAIAADRLKGHALTRAAAGCVIAALGVLTFIQAGYWKDDLLLFDHAVDVNPRSAISYVGLGYALAQRGQQDLAIQNYRRAVELAPHFAHPRHKLGMALLRAGDFSGAAEQLYAAVAEDPDNAGYRIALAGALANAKRYGEARQQIEQAIRLDPTHAAPQINLAMLLAQQGDKQAAVEHYRRALAIEPNNPIALESLRSLDSPSPASTPAR
jgi:Flp pilus assembly protein TadD